MNINLFIVASKKTDGCFAQGQSLEEQFNYCPTCH